MPSLRHRIRGLLAAMLMGWVVPGAAQTIAVSCDVRDVPANYSDPLCQQAPIVFESQVIVLKGAGFTPGWVLAGLYLKTTEWQGRDGGGYVERRVPVPMGGPSYRDGGGRSWNSRVVAPDGNFHVMAYFPEGVRLGPPSLQGGPQALYAEMVDATGSKLGVGGNVARIQVAVTIDLRRSAPQKRIEQELFSCEGRPAQQAQPVRGEQQPFEQPPSARCYAGGTFSFMGGPYHHVHPGGNGFGVGRLVLRPRGENDSLRWQPMRNVRSQVPNPLPDQILRFLWGEWRLPDAPQLAGHTLWLLSVVGQGNTTHDVGLIEIVSPLKVEPPPRVAAQYPLGALARGDTPSFLRPDPSGYYQGGMIRASVPEPAFQCGGSGRENWCVASQSVTRDPALTGRHCAAYLGDTLLEGTLTFGQALGSQHMLSVKVPDGLAVGSHALRLSCPEVKESRTIGERGWQPFEAKAERALRVEAPRVPPSVTVVPPITPPAGDSAYATRQSQSGCAPCNGETYRVEIQHLRSDDQLALVQWSGAETWPPEAATLAREVPATRVPLRARIPEQADPLAYPRHRLIVRLKDARGQVYEVPPQDLGSQPKAGFPVSGEWSFFKSCLGLDTARPPKVLALNNPLDLLTSTRATLRLLNFDCDAALTVNVSVPALGVDQQYALGNTGNSPSHELAIDLAYPEAAWLARVTVPTEANLRFLTPETQRWAGVDLTVLPRRQITLLTHPARAGQRIDVRWKGFQANQGADLLLDEGALNGRPLLLDAGDPTVSARLPEGISGRHQLTLTDAAQSTASTEILIEADAGPPQPPKEPGVPCDKPCVLVPQAARQGELITVRFAAFPRNGLVKFSLNGKWLIKRGQYQASPMERFEYSLPEGLPDGDYQIVGEYGTGTERVMAQGTVRVAGARQSPTLEAVPVPPPDDKRGWYRIGVHRIHVKGLRWTLGGTFSASLSGLRQDGQVDLARLYRLAAPPLDGCLGTARDLFATICDTRAGEINQFWPLEAPVVPGRYVLELMDGLSHIVTQAFDVLPATDTPTQPPPEPPPPLPPAPRPPPPVITPPVQPEPPPLPGGQICNPNLPKYQQKNCIDPPTPRPVAPIRCSPHVPSYSQPNCIP